jgi:hypothetical protein
MPHLPSTAPATLNAGDRFEPRLMFALCSQFIRLGGFFMGFRGPKAHSNRPGGPSHKSAGAGFGMDDVAGVAAVKPFGQAPRHVGCVGL